MWKEDTYNFTFDLFWSIPNWMLFGLLSTKSVRPISEELLHSESAASRGLAHSQVQNFALSLMNFKRPLVSPYTQTV